MERATGLAILIHIAGFAGMTLFQPGWFAALTPYNLLLLQWLGWWACPGDRKGYFLFPTLAYGIGMTVEVVGVQSGMLFGHYRYGTVLGPGVLGVPWLIGLNWFLVAAGAAALADSLHDFVSRILPLDSPAAVSRSVLTSRVITGALLAVLFDRIMEPVAMRLGFWSWQDGQVPLLNYVCWFLVSALLILIGRRTIAPGSARFAARLFLIQAIFFLLLGFFL